MTVDAMLAAELGPPAGELLALLGSPLRAATLLTPLHGSTTPRRSFRIDLEDGRTLKLRRLRSVERAATYVGLIRDLAEPRLSRVLAHREALTLEEWVDGDPLAARRVEPSHLAAAADLLASLHASRPEALRDLPSTLPTQPVRATVEADLRLLLDAGAIDAGTDTRLRAVVAREDPGKGKAGAIHGDFCPENLVVDARGTLRAVDNEALHRGLVGFDLATVAYRWPMTPSEWQDYLRAYGRRADPGPTLRHFAFWKIAAIAKSARVRVSRSARGVEKPLARLRELAAER